MTIDLFFCRLIKKEFSVFEKINDDEKILGEILSNEYH